MNCLVIVALIYCFIVIIIIIIIIIIIKIPGFMWFIVKTQYCLTVGSVPKNVSDVDRKRIADLEKCEAVLKEEVSKLKVLY